MNNQSIASIFIFVLVLFSGAIQADSGQHGKGRFMALFDTNGDDVVTTEEFKAAAAERFRKMDSDSSGSVTQDEFNSYISEKREKWSAVKFQKMDTNGDGNISQAEYLDYKQQKAQRRFHRMDKNVDGLVSTDEFDDSKHYGKKHGRYGKGKIFAKLDKNSDGEITQDESLTAWTEWFTKIDLNGDNVVTVDEVREYRNKNFGNRE